MPKLKENPYSQNILLMKFKQNDKSRPLSCDLSSLYYIHTTLSLNLFLPSYFLRIFALAHLCLSLPSALLSTKTAPTAPRITIWLPHALLADIH